MMTAEFTALDPPAWAELIFAKIDALEQEIRRLFGGFSAQHQSKRLGPTAATKIELTEVVWLNYRGHCPCCLNTLLMDPAARRLPVAEFDHWLDNPNKRRPFEMWLICADCHSNFTRREWLREDYRAAFEAFQLRRRQLQPHEPLLPFPKH